MSPKSAKLGLRHGFTLIELLIVIAVIGMLMSLTIVVMNGISDRAMRAATKATVQKINGLLQQRIESFDQAFTDARRADAIKTARDILEVEIAAVKGAPHSVDSQSAISILAKKLEFRFQFPQRVQDRLDDPANRDPQATGTDLTAPNLPTSLYEVIAFPAARTQLIEETGGTPTDAQVNARVNTNWAKHDRNTESAELLYFALVRSESFGAAASGADEFSAAEISDTDNDGLPEFVDTWGNPLRFYRWPTRLVDHNPPVQFKPMLNVLNDATDTRVITADERRVAGILLKGLPPAPEIISGPQIKQREHLLVDPDDPIGLLYAFLENPCLINIGVDLSNHINEDTFHTIDTYHTPLIVSAGADEQLGLHEPWFTATGIFGTLAQPIGVVLPAVPVYPLTSEDVMLDNVSNRNRRAGGQL